MASVALCLLQITFVLGLNCWNVPTLTEFYFNYTYVCMCICICNWTVSNKYVVSVVLHIFRHYLLPVLFMHFISYIFWKICRMSLFSKICQNAYRVIFAWNNRVWALRIVRLKITALWFCSGLHSAKFWVVPLKSDKCNHYSFGYISSYLVVR